MSRVRLPGLRAVTRQLREMHEAFAHPVSGGEFVGLCIGANGKFWLEVPSYISGIRYGREYIPGDGKKFDAVGAARRLLAAARASERTNG